MQANVAVEVIDFLRSGLKEKLAGRPVKRTGATDFISNAFRETLLNVVSQKQSVDIKKLASEARKNRKPLCIVFVGFNGSGKTTSIAKVAKYLLDAGHKPVLAAADTFRAASIEQLEHHGEKLKVKVVKHNYGSDAAAVVFDAITYAEKNMCNVVLADTAGRMHTDKNLMDELKKVIRVNSPDLKILVVDSLTGNDAVAQAKEFNSAVGVDGVVMSKTDVNEKGGSILSVSYTIKKPIVFLGTGQGYKDIESFKPEKFVETILGG
jgi:fused signal recognition particle receptor